jgi:hypothetical protein
MVGSHGAAESGNGEAASGKGGRLSRFLFAAMALALLAACSAATPPALTAAPEPSGTPAAALQPAAARLPGMRKLTGLSADEVVALFGEPDFRRAEPPAELWQYRSADCVLDLFLYDDAGGFRVAHSETRDRSLVQAGSGQCAGGGAAFARRSRQTRL